MSVAHYRNDLRGAKALIEQALAKLPNTLAQSRLEGRINYYMSAVYREKKKWPKAEEYIVKAQEVKAIVLYMYICAFMFFTYSLFICVTCCVLAIRQCGSVRRHSERLLQSGETSSEDTDTLTCRTRE